jgi:hypothetical protein
MGKSISMLSLLGIVALTGVVVNDSIVMIDATNRLRASGATRWQSLMRAGQIRLRPIMLTTITTVLGLMPLSFAGSESQAAFLAPMAVALSAGLAVATCFLVFLIPCIDAVMDDLLGSFGRSAVTLPEIDEDLLTPDDRAAQRARDGDGTSADIRREVARQMDEAVPLIAARVASGEYPILAPRDPDGIQPDGADPR